MGAVRVVLINGHRASIWDSAVGVRLRWFAKALRFAGFDVVEIAPVAKIWRRGDSTIAPWLVPLPPLNFLFYLAISILFVPLALLHLLVLRPSVIVVSIPPPVYLPSYYLAAKVLKKFRRMVFIVDYRDDVLDFGIYQQLNRERLIGIKALLQLTKSALLGADLVVTVTGMLQRKLAGYGIVSVVVPNGSDLRPMPHVEKFPQFTAIFVSESFYWGGYYRLDVAVEALRRAVEICGDVRLVVVGRVSPALRKWVEKYAERYGVGDRVVLLGPLPHEKLPEVVARAHVGLVLYDDREVWRTAVPSKFYEYISLGLPVIATVVTPSELGELVGRYGCGFVLKPFDVEGVARAICEFKQNRELYEQARRGALRLFRERHRAVISRYFSNIIKMLVSKSIK